MASPILNLRGKVDANNALVVVSEGSGGSAGTGGVVGTLSDLQGKVDSSNRLIVRIGT